jgi:hypothetical protein
LALHWFRRYHKRLLIPLAVVVIFTFVVLPNLESDGGGSDDRWVSIEGETLGAGQQQAYSNALLVIARARGTPVGLTAHLYYIVRAKLAEKAGIKVPTSQVREAIRGIMSAPGLLGKSDFTNAEYRARLQDLQVQPAVFEDFVRRFIAAETLKYVMQSAAYIGGEELKLAFRRDGDRVRLRVKDFKVADFAKEAAAPTDEEIAKYYAEHKDLPLRDDIALATEPEVSIEYAFVEKRGAEALAKKLRKLDEGLRFEALLGGPGAALAGRLAEASLLADHEEQVLSRYESDKRSRYKLPAPKPKAVPKGEDKDAKKDAKKQGAVQTSGAGLASMVLLPALAAPAPEEPPAEPEPPEEPEEKFKPLEEVRDQVEQSVAQRAYRDAASRSARRFQDVVSERERLRPLGADALGAGLALAGLPALEGAAGTPARFDVLDACKEAGAVHGVTRLAKPDALKQVPGLGTLRNIPDTAVSRAESGSGAEWTGPSGVGSGSIVWRVADYVEPRLLTLEEAKATIRERIIHERATVLAAKAAEKFRRNLQAGKVGVAEMTLTPPLKASDPKAGPFAEIGIAEVAAEAVAVGKERGARVVVNIPDRTAELGRTLSEANVTAEAGEIAEISGRLANETRAWQTALYRVAVPVERDEPSHSEYASWRGGRQASRLEVNRGAFMVGVWNDVALDQVKWQESEAFSEWVKRVRESR